MTLPSALPISASQINVELGRAGTDPFDIQGTQERGLANVPSGPISFSDFAGKSSIGISLTYSSFTGGKVWTGKPCGTPAASRRIYLGLIHDLVSNDPGTTPSLTVDGVGATLISAGTTGGPNIPATNATGCAWFRANPSGATCDISASWAAMANLGIIVLATNGLTTTVDSEIDGGNYGLSDGIVGLNTAVKGAVIGLSNYAVNAGAVSWTELTKQLDYTDTFGGNNYGSLAWQLNQDGANHTLHVNPHPAGEGSYLSNWISLGA